MTKTELKLLHQFRIKSPIGRHDLNIVKHLERMGLIKIDSIYKNTINGVIISYAETTALGFQVIEMHKWYKKIPFIKIFFKQ